MRERRASRSPRLLERNSSRPCARLDLRTLFSPFPYAKHVVVSYCQPHALCAYVFRLRCWNAFRSALLVSDLLILWVSGRITDIVVCFCCAIDKNRSEILFLSDIFTLSYIMTNIAIAITYKSWIPCYISHFSSACSYRAR